MSSTAPAKLAVCIGLFVLLFIWVFDNREDAVEWIKGADAKALTIDDGAVVFLQQE
jgi:hypothetical protein